MRLKTIAAAGFAVLALSATTVAKTDVDFALSEGLNLNLIARDGPVAAHVLARAGTSPRLIVAFPAGNSGAGIWFKPLATKAEWRQLRAPEPLRLRDGKDRSLYGVRVSFETTARRLEPSEAVLSSVRVLRDYEIDKTLPEELKAAPTVAGNTITYARDRLDGKAGYLMKLVVDEGKLENGALVAPAQGRLRLTLIAASGETPLTPLEGGALLNSKHMQDDAAVRALTFLSYREKFLAGSWRFNTYFGRDTLMSVRLLMPVLAPEAVETGLRSVLTRLSPKGEVAHEEDIGEFAILDHRRAGQGLSDAPVYDYKMIDGDFMLAPVMENWLSDPRAKNRAAGLLAQSDGAHKLGDALVRNLKHVVESARGFAETPRYDRLIALKQGMSAGQWRDSNTGLGGGRYPYDVNAVFVPAALRATIKLVRSGVLDPYLTAEDHQTLAEATRMESVWSREAPKLFEIALPAGVAAKSVSAYAMAERVPERPALAALHGAPLRFNALALKDDGTPVKVENSDIGFALLFAEPSISELSQAADLIARPFPAGLMTGAGMLVANPAFEADETRALFHRNAYHGTVIWSWQQAVAAAGLERQLQRKDLPVPVRRKLETAQTRLWAAITSAKRMRSSELWSWDYSGGAYHIVPFGAAQGDADESNALQLWSTVFLALHPASAKTLESVH
ncbi:glycogen debranching enzyme [Rhizomicrobium palustre]|uniref:Glycogen debranching enzyme n=1 Tax=Rhizomicrobium palustre TaxID=189966 RepID=A0A846MXQ1_9PROT|nr:hypothetical protein [Rhizomicrobium palustre]NIK88019.1 glycogen debranching enzyme [Rhizomicrobium palustre]